MAKKRTVKHLVDHSLYYVEYVDENSGLKEKHFVVRHISQILEELKDCVIYEIKFLHHKSDGVTAIF